MGCLFICLRPVKPILETRGSSGAALSQKVDAGAYVTRGGPGAGLSREAGVRTTGTRGSLRAAPCQEAGVVILMLIRGVSAPQGTDRVQSMCIHYRSAAFLTLTFFPFCFKMFFFLLGFLTCSCKVIICMLFSEQKSPLHATWRHHFTQHWDARQAAETESAISFQ
jgi:hypothetical protein